VENAVKNYFMVEKFLLSKHEVLEKFVGPFEITRDEPTLPHFYPTPMHNAQLLYKQQT
jgi:hypothetical protein